MLNSKFIHWNQRIFTWCCLFASSRTHLHTTKLKTTPKVLKYFVECFHVHSQRSLNSNCRGFCLIALTTLYVSTPQGWKVSGEWLPTPGGGAGWLAVGAVHWKRTTKVWAQFTGCVLQASKGSVPSKISSELLALTDQTTCGIVSVGQCTRKTQTESCSQRAGKLVLVLFPKMWTNNENNTISLQCFSILQTEWSTECCEVMKWSVSLKKRATRQ